MKYTRLPLFVLLLLIGFPGLHVLRATQEFDPQQKPVPLTPLGPKRSGPRTSFSGSQIKDPFRVVVRSRDEWLAVWKTLYQIIPSNGPYPDPPEIDFSREMLIVAAMGQRPTSGYAIIIDSAYEQSDRLEVVVTSVITIKCGGVYTSVTSPIDIVRLPKLERPVVFRELEVVPACKLE
jgi:hypothetical protein